MKNAIQSQFQFDLVLEDILQNFTEQKFDFRGCNKILFQCGNCFYFKIFFSLIFCYCFYFWEDEYCWKGQEYTFVFH